MAVKGSIPVPVNATECGLPEELSVTVMDAALAPAVTGANLTEMVHEPPAATVAPHVLVCVNSAALAPAD